MSSAQKIIKYLAIAFALFLTFSIISIISYGVSFIGNLFDSDKLLINTTMCDDKIDDLTKIKCDKKNDQNKIGILSLNDYYVSGGKEGFLNNSDTYFLNTLRLLQQKLLVLISLFFHLDLSHL